MQRPGLIARGLRRHATPACTVAGAIAGGLYTAQSAPHMVVSAAHDKLIVGFMLAVTGAAIGWLTGCLVAAGVRGRSEEC